MPAQVSSTCENVLVALNELHREDPDAHARIWPLRDALTQCNLGQGIGFVIVMPRSRVGKGTVLSKDALFKMAAKACLLEQSHQLILGPSTY